MKKVRQHFGLEKDDNSLDESIMELTPEEVFSEVCEWEGLINYSHTLLSWIRDIFGVNLDSNERNFGTLDIFEDDDNTCTETFKETFVRGLGNIFRALPYGESHGVESMECDPDTELVTIHFQGGGVNYANVNGDSASATMLDIIRQGLS